MPEFVYLTGFEHGLARPTGGGQGIISGSSGVLALATGTAVNSGEYALLIDATGASKFIMLPSDTFTGANGNGILVGRFYFKFDSFPTSNRVMFVAGMNGVDCSMWYRSVDNGVLMGFDSPGSREGYTPIVTGTWYRMDFVVDCSHNSWVVYWAIDGHNNYASANTYEAGTTQQLSALRLGSSSSLTYTIYFDDVAFTTNFSDYPLGPGKTIGLRPSADGTHNAGTNVMEDQDGADIGVVTAYNLLDENPWITGSTQWVRQAANSTSNYAEIEFANVPAGVEILGVQGILQYRGATSTADRGAGFILDENGVGTELWGLPSGTKDYSETNPFYRKATIPVPGGGSWTESKVNNLKARIGYSDDTNPNPYWLALILEVGYQEAGAHALTASGTFVNSYVGPAWLFRYGIISETDVETGDFSQFNFVSTNGGRFAVSGSAALAGTNYGISILHELGNTTAMYAKKDYVQPDTSGIIRARYYIDPNTLGFSGSDLEDTLTFRNPIDNWLFITRFGKQGANYVISCGIYDDDGLGTESNRVIITDEPHWVEVLGKRATTRTSIDGFVQLWVDDVSGTSVYGIDNYDRWDVVDSFRFGAVASIDAGTSGTYFLDELVVNNTGEYIGPKGGSGPVVHDLTASGTYVSTYVGNPYLNQEHGLQASGIYCNTYVGNPYLSQEHALFASGIYVNTYIGNPYLGQGHGLGSTGITVGSTVGTPYISQEHGLSVGGISSSPTCGTPGLGQEHGLGCTGIVAGSTVGTPSLGQAHALVAGGITVGSTVGSPTLSESNGLSSNGLTVTTYVGNPYISQEHGLSAGGITSSPTVGTPGVGQDHGLASTGIVVGSEVGTPYLNQEHTLTTTGIVVGSTVGTPALASTGGFMAGDLTVTTHVGNPSLSQEHALTATGITVTTTAGTPYINQEHAFGPVGLSVGSTIGSSYLGQEHGLGATGLTSTPTVGTCGLGQDHDLGGGGIVVGGECGIPYISQTHVLTAVGITVTTSVGDPTLAPEGTMLPIGITVSTYVGSPYISQEHVLGSVGIVSDPTVGTPYIGQNHVLGGGGIVVGGTVGDPTISEGAYLEGSGITVGGTVGDPGISQTHVFGSGGIGSGPVVGQPGPGQEHILTIGGITISSSVGNPALVSPPVTGGLFMRPIFKKIEQGIEKGMVDL